MRAYIPPQNKKNAVCYFLGIICGSLLFAVSAFLPVFKGVLQLAAFCFWAFGIWVLCRYSLTYFYYIIDGDNFRIVKVSGQKHTDVGNVSMRTGKFVKKLSEAKDRPPVSNRFDYCRNYIPAEKYVYFFEWNGACAEIIFEPNEEFALIMSEKLAQLQRVEPQEPTNGWYDE
jgi:hypothetical protein